MLLLYQMTPFLRSFLTFVGVVVALVLVCYGFQQQIEEAIDVTINTLSELVYGLLPLAIVAFGISLLVKKATSGGKKK